jgi:hypothetical protein
LVLFLLAASSVGIFLKQIEASANDLRRRQFDSDDVFRINECSNSEGSITAATITRTSQSGHSQSGH